MDTQVCCTTRLHCMLHVLYCTQIQMYLQPLVFIARCNMYISCLCYDVSVRLSVNIWVISVVMKSQHVEQLSTLIVTSQCQRRHVANANVEPVPIHKNRPVPIQSTVYWMWFRISAKICSNSCDPVFNL